MDTVIYYPYTYPTPSWLRLGALCWEKVFVLGARRDGGTLVPPPEVAELDNALGGVLDTSIAIELLLDEELEGQFKKWVEEHEDELKRHGLSNEHQPLFGLYDSKFQSPAATEESIRDWLGKRGLARIEWADKEKFGLDKHPTEAGYSAYVAASMVYLPKEIALHYLSLCASRAARDGNRDLAADGERFAATVFSDYRSVRGEVASTVLEAYVPEDLDRFEPARLLELREELSSRRLAFQSAIQSISREFLEVASEGQTEAVKKKIVDLAKQRIEETRNAYSRTRVDFVVKSLSVSLAPPALVATLASMLGIGIFAPAAVGATVALAAAGLLGGLEKARAEREKSPWSYALELQRA